LGDDVVRPVFVADWEQVAPLRMLSDFDWTTRAVEQESLGTARLMPMIEAQVQAAFVKYLIERGWEVTTDNADYTDVMARRGDDLLLAEVKGTTSSSGLDVDSVRATTSQDARAVRDSPIRLGRAGVGPKVCSPCRG